MSAGCIFYSPITEKVIAGLKRNRIEGIGGKPIESDRSSYETALRESLEELTGVSINIATLEMHHSPDPVCCFITNNDYEIYVHTYDDYASIASAINEQLDINLPRTIYEVLATQQGGEHRLLLEVSYKEHEGRDILLHDYFANDLRLLEHSLSYNGYFYMAKAETDQGETVYHFECVVEQASVIYTDSYMSVSSSNDSEELEAFVTKFVRIMKS